MFRRNDGPILAERGRPSALWSTPGFGTWPLPFLLFVAGLALRVTTSAVPLGSHAICSRIPGLSDKQRTMCRAAPDAVAALGDGIRMGFEECRHQFQGHRWNCSGVGDENVFGHVIVVGSKEAAFTYAIASAGVTYAISAACSRGNISSCGCHSAYRTRSDQHFAPTGFKWGGCSADVSYGMRFARRFLDSREIEGDARSLMNLHNNRAGRKMVKMSLKTECKCHGVSGSCALRTCWKALPPFRTVGDALMLKYRKSKSVTSQTALTTKADDDGDKSGLELILRRPPMRAAMLPTSKRLPKKVDLVYIQPSPNYCEKDLLLGSFGTVGRLCNRTSSGHDGCDLLCCGRGYNTHQIVKTSQCHCKFHWCCFVECDICTERKEEYTCK